ncbi:MAG: 50S ribosomal protein L6 [Chlamydiae bacterium]|nr:50S ribosomal protein L6 [Chlamydiota bacterium]
MSRLGKTPIDVPNGIEIKVVGRKLNVKGPKGDLSLELIDGLSVNVENGKALVEIDEAKEVSGSFHGLYRSLLNNMIVGTSKGFEKKLVLIGVGYRASVQGSKLDLQLGFSHPVQLDIPKSIQVSVEKSTTITITGADKHTVGQFAAAIRAKKAPEPYKGKGIRYENEYVRKKAGKAAKGKTG